MSLSLIERTEAALDALEADGLRKREREITTPQSAHIGVGGREVLNLQISLLLYSLVGVLLTFVLIGIPILIAVAAAALILPILGAVKAQEGVCYRFPLILRLI